MFRNRKTINFLSKYYYKLAPDFILNSKRFHEILYRILIGKWFSVNFKEECKKYSDEEWAELYDSLFTNRIREDDLTRNQKKYTLKNILGPSVLEIGCGGGTMIEEIILNKKAKRIVGNDISPKIIKFLNKKFSKFPYVSFLQGDFLKLEIKEKFDTVLCLHTLEHIGNVERAVNLMIKTAKKRIIIIVPNEYPHLYPPNYHLHFFNQTNSVTELFKNRRNKLKIIDGDYVLISNTNS